MPSGIPYDVLKESIVHSPNEKSDRFLYLAASFFLKKEEGAIWENVRKCHGCKGEFLPAVHTDDSTFLLE